MSGIILLSVDQFVSFVLNLQLRDLELICFLYKTYDYLCAGLWFCGAFMLRLTFYFPSCCL